MYTWLEPHWPIVWLRGPSDQVLFDHAPIEGQLVQRQAPGLGGGLDQPIGIGGVNAAAHQKHHQVGAIGDLGLVPGLGAQFGLDRRIGDHRRNFQGCKP
jgi:hypothetical protein